ncbi:MAG: hypothetical protein A3B31_00340 [Candidatus Komeilibacteria bacterium RIFCSPLOWO2_01_FULL_53_11]|uniref:Uncharacterized protein n=1 Tax=Candidatus Komeilibacteria bacterium RIFCSPLOWO2_01_FULL_53_11 TaxID=1798552 RepID=A0A1G2BV43_9BACT|nr:MAG: hypothetical protein A3B31_00340 [Candidatus Komeilibacteria bacterium RIFCSPLOWO2_01_FULL_53_11]
MLTEKQVEASVRSYLIDKEWVMSNTPRSQGQHGVDIYAKRPKWGKYYYIECKGDSKRDSTRHDKIYHVLGQIMSRMNKKGNTPNSSRYYAIALPISMKKVFIRKVSNMQYSWRVLKLKTFWVSEDFKVEEVSSARLIF